MVVTRKTTVPMPPASRTTSSQTAPKLNKGKTPQSPLIVHDVDETFLNGGPSLEDNHSGPQFSDDVLFSDGSPPRKVAKDKSKTKSRRKEGKALVRRKRRPTGWLDLFSRTFILAFLIYSLSVCPTADKQKSTVCRALFEYRRLVLEPYVIAPVQNLLHHPSVSPYTTPIIQKAQPIISRSQQEWNSRVVPQWEKHVVPAWNARVSPQLAQLDAKVDPYRQQVLNLYDKHAALYVKQAQALAYKSQPYVVLASAKTYDAYQTSKPYLARASVELQRIPPIVVEYVLRPLASARRQYVDPHVALLLEKIQELSSGASKTELTHDDVRTSSPVSTSTASRQLNEAGKSVEVEIPVVSESVRGSDTLSSAASIASASLSLGSTIEESSSVDASTLSSDLPRESATIASASSVLSASLTLGNEATESVPGATYSPRPAMDKDTNVSPGRESESEANESVVANDDAEGKSPIVVGDTKASSSVTDDETEAPSSQASVSASIEVPQAHRPPVSPGKSGEADDDLSDLLAELGLDLEETVVVSNDPTSAPSVVEETEEEKAAREAQYLAEVAAKRQELTARHARWEEKLEGTIEEQKVELKEDLASIRRTGAAELKINLAIRAGIETLNSEAEKALRGTDAYFTKLRTGGKPLAEQARLWDRVLEKVQAKFEDRVQDVEEAVNKWYEEEVLSKERQAIEKASNTVRSVADEAQADIGLDYAWLDDVTYMDWRRYHALVDKHQTFLDEQIALANGSHATAYPNPVFDAFEDIRSEVQDITIGFETRMRRIKREGERAFADSRGENEEFTPEVSVLPVADGDKKEDKAFQEVADAILGRSEEEVADALGRAQEQEHHAMHEEL